MTLTSGYHSQNNGQAERPNQCLETGFQCVSSQNSTSWSKMIIWIEYTHNTLPSASTGLTPFQCVYGYKPPLFPELEQAVNVPSATAMVRRCWRMWAHARQSLLHSSAVYKKAADRRHRLAPVYSPGRESGSQPKTCLLAQNCVSWHPGSLVYSLCQKLLITLL